MTMGLVHVGKRGRPKRRSEDPLMTFLIATWLVMAVALVSLLIYVITDDVQDGGHALPAPYHQSVSYTSGDTSHDALL
jgi:hypothetical protein